MRTDRSPGRSIAATYASVSAVPRTFRIAAANSGNTPSTSSRVTRPRNVRTSGGPSWVSMQTATSGCDARSTTLGRSGVSPYQQIVQQVRNALRLGLLREGDQLPTVKDVVAALAINPNTVLKAYRELEHEGLVQARPGRGTFVTRTLTDNTLAAHGPLRQDLRRWLAKARKAGLDDESIEALFLTTFRSAAQEDIA